VEGSVIDILFGGGAVWFGIPAVVGTIFFIGRVVLMLVGGGDFHHDAGFDLTGDVDAGGVDFQHPDSDTSFNILSIQAIAAFMMGFGWGGLGVVRGWGLPALLGVPIGIVTGGAMVWFLGRLLMLIAKMQSSGTLSMASALYEEGVVYVTVPAERHGRGSVRVIVDNRMQYYQAVTDGAALETSALVRVTAVNEDNTLTVERLTPELPPTGV
jgi:hypothetical protein